MPLLDRELEHDRHASLRLVEPITDRNEENGANFGALT